MKVGFLGLGNMGVGIARNLIKAGHSVTVYNRTRSRTEEFASSANIVSTPAEAASGADAVMTMLADDHALESVVFGKDGFLTALPASAAHISLSTISVALSRRLAEAHAAKRQHYISAPVFGRPDAAAAGKLVVVAAGAKDQIEHYQPLLEAIGQKLFVVSEQPAAANVIKLTGNFLITTVIESLAEAFALTRKSGVDSSLFFELLTTTLFSAPVYKTYGSMIAADKFEPVGFRMPLGFKDNRLVLAAAEEASVPMPMASLVHDRFVAALAQGMKDADWSAIARLSAQSAGL